MNELRIAEVKTMTSMQIAKMFNKRHDHVVRKILALCERYDYKITDSEDEFDDPLFGEGVLRKQERQPSGNMAKDW